MKRDVYSLGMMELDVGVMLLNGRLVVVMSGAPVNTHITYALHTHYIALHNITCTR